MRIDEVGFLSNDELDQQTFTNHFLELAMEVTIMYIKQYLSKKLC